MHFIGQIALLFAGAGAAKLLDRNKPDWTQTIGGFTVSPGTIAAAVGAGAALVTKSPALGLLAGGAVVGEGLSVAERDLFPKLDAYLTPSNALPAGTPAAKAVSGMHAMHGQFGRVHAMDLAQGLHQFGMRAA